MGRSIRERIATGMAAFNKKRRLWKNREISMALKLRLLSAIIIPTVIYGSECWNI